MSFSLKRDWYARLGVPRIDYLNHARTHRAPQDWNQFQRGISFLDNGIHNLDLQGEVVIGVDPGIANVVCSVDADFHNLAIQANPVHPDFEAAQQAHSTNISNGQMRQINYSKRQERNEQDCRIANPALDLAYNILAANSPRVHRTLESWCTYVNLVHTFRELVFYNEYQQLKHRRWRFRGHATRQRADQMTINRLAGDCRPEEFAMLQNRLEPGGAKVRRALRYAANIPAYAMNNRVFAWGQGGFSHTRPWAPIPQQRLMKKAAASHRVVLINENNTSKVCLFHAVGYENPIAIVDHPVVTPRKLWSTCGHRKRTTRQVNLAAWPHVGFHWRKWCVGPNLLQICPSYLCPDLPVPALRPCHRLVQCNLRQGGPLLMDRDVSGAGCHRRLLYHYSNFGGRRPVAFQ